MNDQIEIPAKGQPMKAGWGASVANAVNRLTVSAPANMLVRDGAGGFGFAALPTNMRDRRGSSTAFLHPWKVKGCTKGENCDHLFEIYIPTGALHVGEDAIDIEGVTGNAIDSEPTGDATFYLVISSEANAGEDGAPKAKIVTTVSEGDDEIVAVIPVATVTVEEVGEGGNATTRGVVTAQHLTTAVGLPEPSGSGVTSLNDGTGDMDVIGGEHISIVVLNKRTIRVSYDKDKTSPDSDPNEDPNKKCQHPGNDSGSLEPEDGGGGVDGGGDRSGAGDTGCCGGASSTGGTGSGSPEEGVPGKPVDEESGPEPGGPNGKETQSAPSEGGTTQSAGVNGKPAPLYDGTHTPITDTKSPIYSGKHTGLTDSKKMNESPFKQDSGFRPIGSGVDTPIADTKKPIKSGSHDQLTDTKKLNKSPFSK